MYGGISVSDKCLYLGNDYKENVGFVNPNYTAGTSPLCILCLNDYNLPLQLWFYLKIEIKYASMIVNLILEWTSNLCLLVVRGIMEMNKYLTFKEKLILCMI